MISEEELLRLEKEYMTIMEQEREFTHKGTTGPPLKWGERNIHYDRALHLRKKESTFLAVKYVPKLVCFTGDIEELNRQEAPRWYQRKFPQLFRYFESLSGYKIKIDKELKRNKANISGMISDGRANYYEDNCFKYRVIGIVNATPDWSDYKARSEAFSGTQFRRRLTKKQEDVHINQYWKILRKY